MNRYSVRQRTQEIGIRLALGADSGRVRQMVVWQGMLLALVGVAIGLGAAFALTRLIATILFGVKPNAPALFVTVAAVLALVSLAAAWFPARRATRIDPVVALRYEKRRSCRQAHASGRNPAQSGGNPAHHRRPPASLLVYCFGLKEALEGNVG